MRSSDASAARSDGWPKRFLSSFIVVLLRKVDVIDAWWLYRLGLPPEDRLAIAS